MKKNIFICLLIFYKTIFLAQHSETKKEARYEMYAAGGKPVKSITLKNAQKLDDVLESYPNSWISSYQSVKISAINNGDTIK